ncbi:MAG: hypothetical protein WCV90_06415 [Candidatus Woesearchaeota archaeon]|jgi:hypothetical protein
MIGYIKQTVLALTAFGFMIGSAYAEQRDFSPQKQLARVEAQIKTGKGNLEELRELRSYFRDSASCDALQQKYWKNCQEPEQRAASEKLCASLDAEIDSLWESWLETPDFNQRLDNYGFCGQDYVGD